MHDYSEYNLPSHVQASDTPNPSGLTGIIQTSDVNSLKCQTSTATPAEPGGLPWDASFCRNRRRNRHRVPSLSPARSRAAAELYPHVVKALECPSDRYKLTSLRYDLSKLRAKGLVTRLPNSRRYQLLPHGYSICLVFLKLFERIYAPLAAGLLSPVSADARIHQQKRSQLDRLRGIYLIRHIECDWPAGAGRRRAYRVARDH